MNIHYFHNNDEELEDDCFPANVTSICFGYYFNKNVDSLPNSITSITFGYSFNKNVDSLPNSVTSIIFGYSFDRPVDNLPDSVTNIIFGHSFNKPLNNLPKSVTSIVFSPCFGKYVNVEQTCIRFKFDEDIINFHVCNSINVYIKKFIYDVCDNVCHKILNCPFSVKSIESPNIKKIPYGGVHKLCGHSLFCGSVSSHLYIRMCK